METAAARRGGERRAPPQPLLASVSAASWTEMESSAELKKGLYAQVVPQGLRRPNHLLRAVREPRGHPVVFLHGGPGAGT